MTSTARIDHAAWMTRHSRVCSSIKVRIRNRVPASVWSSTKSQLHTWRARSARCRWAVEAPCRRMRRWRLLTLRPSSRRMRLTRLGLTVNPSRLKSAVIRRYVAYQERDFEGWKVDAHKDGQRHQVIAEDLNAAFFELQRSVRSASR